MFTHLTDFGFKRTSQQAIGFYIVYFIAVIVLGALAAMLFASDYTTGVGVGTAVAAIFCWLLSFLILKAKKSTKDTKLLGIGILSGVLAFFVGGIVGLIPVAYLTMK